MAAAAPHLWPALGLPASQRLALLHPQRLQMGVHTQRGLPALLKPYPPTPHPNMGHTAQFFSALAPGVTLGPSVDPGNQGKADWEELQGDPRTGLRPAASARTRMAHM